MRDLWRSLQWLALALALVGWLQLTGVAPVLAAIHTYHEQPGQTTYRSRQSLRDQRDLAWQVAVFKRYIGADLQGVYLRVVGFPGQLVDRAGPLLVQTGTTAQWSAPYQMDPQTQTLPDNVAQYDVQAVMAQLQRPIPLTLVVPLAGAAQARLVVAPYVVEEWLQLYGLADAAVRG